MMNPLRRGSRIALVAAALAAVFAAATLTATAAPSSPPAASEATAGCGQSPSLSSGTHTIQSGGQNRSFILDIPDGYDPNYAHRLVFGFHWWGGTADDVASGGSDGAPYAYYGLKPQANGTTIFVAPQGIDNGWPNPGGRDVAFFDDMLSLITDDLCIDQDLVFSLGFSYGGSMSYALACARPDVIRAVAAIAAPGPISGCDGGTEPVAYMGIHGLDDQYGIEAGRQLRDTFVANNGCTPQNPPEPARGSLTHITTAYSGCMDGYPVVWAAFDGGHQQGPVDGCSGCESGADSWVKDEVWAFFTQFESEPPDDGTTPPDETTDPGETTSPPPTGDDGCTAEIDVANDWGSGWQGNVLITAGDSAVSGWTLTWTWPGGQSITSSWNAEVSTSGAAVTASDVGWNGTIQAGQTSSAWGFIGSGPAASPAVTCTAA